MPSIKYEEMPSDGLSDADLERSATLFSNHYGTWAAQPQLGHKLKPGDHVRMSAKRLRKEHLFDSDRCCLIRAMLTDPASGSETLVGQAFVHRYEVPGKGTVSWITQLVVHSGYRKLGIGKKLCHIARAVDHFYAAGLVTSHPYAVRAVERATERSCDRSAIVAAAAELVEHAGIPYIKDRELCFSGGRCLIDTGFYVDHTEVDGILAQMKNWPLGPLEQGQEFIAFTFAVSPRTSPSASLCKV